MIWHGLTTFLGSKVEIIFWRYQTVLQIPSLVIITTLVIIMYQYLILLIFCQSTNIHPCNMVTISISGYLIKHIVIFVLLSSLSIYEAQHIAILYLNHITQLFLCSWQEDLHVCSVNHDALSRADYLTSKWTHCEMSYLYSEVRWDSATALSQFPCFYILEGVVWVEWWNHWV